MKGMSIRNDVHCIRTVHEEILYMLFLFSSNSSTLLRQVQVLVPLQHINGVRRVKPDTRRHITANQVIGSQGDIASTALHSKDFTIKFMKYLPAPAAHAKHKKHGIENLRYTLTQSQFLQGGSLDINVGFSGGFKLAYTSIPRLFLIVNCYFITMLSFSYSSLCKNRHLNDNKITSLSDSTFSKMESLLFL